MFLIKQMKLSQNLEPLGPLSLALGTIYTADRDYLVHVTDAEMNPRETDGRVWS